MVWVFIILQIFSKINEYSLQGYQIENDNFYQDVLEYVRASIKSKKV